MYIKHSTTSDTFVQSLVLYHLYSAYTVTMAKREKASESFVERPQEETQKSKSRRLSIRVNDEGTIDWSESSEEQKKAFIDVITSDPDTLEAIGAAVGDGELGDLSSGPVTADHVATALIIFGKAQAKLVPFAIKKKTDNRIIIPNEVSEKIFETDPEWAASVAPDGAQMINESVIPHLPDWLVNFITEIGPGEKFISAVLFDSYLKYTALMKYIDKMPKTVDAEVTTTSATEVAQ